MSSIIKNLPPKLYHSTHRRNLPSLLEHGLEPRGMEGVTYFADSFGGAVTFAYVHGIRLEDILVLVVNTDVMDNHCISEGTDHNRAFFKDIEVFAYPETIPVCDIEDWQSVAEEYIKSFYDKKAGD